VLGDFSEEEAETRIRKQMLRNIYLGPNRYCYALCGLPKGHSSTSALSYVKGLIVMAEVVHASANIKILQ
jgi:hypothetical protein